MSLLAPLGFIILILTLGFRYNNWTLSFIIFLFGSVFALLLGISNIEEIKRNWNERRCDLDIMVTAQLYKPEDDGRTGGEFAAENFNFCVKNIIVSVITIALTPLFALVNQQLDVTESINDVFNRLRVVQANFLKGFMSILDPFFARFKTSSAEFGVTYQKLLSAMGRAFGITQAILYIGMSLVITIENFVQFVINVVLIIMYIILGLMILLWLLILPVFGIIIFTCQVIGNSPFGYLSEDVCGELCFDPATRIRLQSGKITTLADVKVGDILEDGSIIEGILVASGEQEPVLVLDGIRVTGAHLVWFDEKEEWIAVANHPSSILSFQKSSRLICLRTNTRTIPIQGLSKEWNFRDWEELPSNLPSSDTIWDFLVSEILNKKPGTQETPQEHPLLLQDCQVMYKTGEIRSIAEVQIGDVVYSSEGYTKVTGFYTGEAFFEEGKSFTDGVWLKDFLNQKWTHSSSDKKEKQLHKGFHLTTESGCFWIQTKDFSGFIRDFTEVGASNLFLTYNYTRALLKKSMNREESCVSGSLSQVLSSCSQPIS
jgi:hypothetical protein